MENKPDEEHVDDTTIPFKDTEPINPKQETENMEVHHHPQVEKKNFKEYLLEGLMIFFAVMLGFFAENIRENIVEHNRAQVLAQSLFEDIKKDTAALHTVIDFSYKKASA